MNRSSWQNRQKSPILLPNCYQNCCYQTATKKLVGKGLTAGDQPFSARLKYQLLARRERLYGSVHLTAWVCRKMYCIYRAIVYRRPQIARPSHQENRHVLVTEQD